MTLMGVCEKEILHLRETSEVEWWKSIFDALPDPTFVSHAPSGRIQVANKACVRLFNCAVDEVIGRTTTELGMFQSKAQRDALVREALATPDFVEWPFWDGEGNVRRGQFSVCEVHYEGVRTLINIIRILPD